MHSVVGIYNTCIAGVDLVFENKMTDSHSSIEKLISRENLFFLFFTLLTKVGTNFPLQCLIVAHDILDMLMSCKPKLFKVQQVLLSRTCVGCTFDSPSSQNHWDDPFRISSCCNLCCYTPLIP